MPNFTTPVAGGQADLRYFASDAGCNLPEGTEWAAHNPLDGAVYEDALRQAFNFLRRHDDGRYSSRMKMRVLQAAEQAEAGRVNSLDADYNLPGVVTLMVPFSFDEDSEVKTGGMLGVAVVWPTEGGRLMLAVNQSNRRQRLGSLLFGILQYPVQAGSLTSWVNRSNTIGQHFLLSRGFSPTGFNQSGGVCWTYGSDNNAEGVEDHIDPLDTLTSTARRARRQRRSESRAYASEPEDDDRGYDAVAYDDGG